VGFEKSVLPSNPSICSGIAFTNPTRPRYVCVERLSDLPLVGMAYLYVESLLVPAGPWTRRSTAVPH